MCSFDLNRQVKNVLVALDVTMDTVKYAIDNGYDTVISHHPLVFRSQKGLASSNYTQKKLIELVKNDINVLSFHTRLDAAFGGVNDTLCAVLGLKNVVSDPLDPIGRVGELDKSIALSTFAENVKSSLNSPVVLYAGDKEVRKIYVVGGDGKDLIPNAISCGADTLLTGRASYNTMIDATDIPDLKSGDTVELLNYGYTAEDMAREIGTIGYEVIAKIGKRVPRIYLNG